ncbi:MAG: nuclear transport factor 2 family protein [Myxococcota bacterium]
MHPNARLLTEFYDAFNRHDGDEMATAYHDAAHFSDPVFPDLDAPAVRDMWKMLTSSAPDLRVEATGIEADDEVGRVHWEAWYTFSKTGNEVHNIIDATFQFREGKIVRHVDDFDFWRWTRQALGVTGILLGWTPMVRNKVQSMAARRLEKWRASEAR